MSCIYGLFDPSKTRKLIRYVGFTSGSPEARLFGHMAWALNYTGNKRPERFANWLRKFAKKGKLPGVEVLEEIKDRKISWEERERYWIKHYSSPKLFNIAIGGIGGAFRVKAQLTLQARHAKQLSKENTKRIWVNNGERNLWVKPEDTPEGFARGRIFNEAVGDRVRGKVWITDGRISRLLAPGERIPINFRVGRTVRRGYNAEVAKKQGAKWVRSCWITNGGEVKRLLEGEPVPEGWVAGRRQIRWITNGRKSRQIPADEPLPSGWRYGRKIERNR